MKIKPILFNTEMVRAILEKRKTVTRRVVKPQPEIKPIPTFGGSYRVSMKGDVFVKPPYRPGDILYVRETWNRLLGEWIYKANQKPEFKNPGNWHPSIHMPREAARIFLRVTDVRVERLQNMTEDDAFAEGYIDKDPWCFHHVYENYPESPIPCYASSCKCPPDPPCDHSIPELFGKEIWNSTIKPADRALYNWEANPYVWVIEFERCEKPKGEDL